ncbi:MAG: hypothetical protein HQ567_01470 [Candidatus Nealsonbacteria bacterium]|nr:hypothetical protein [Candidatus Nealsonbacteria bacterium]
MDVSTSCWKDFFCNWPKGMAPTGVLVTTFGEQVPFSSFMTGKTLLMMERKTPDSLGCRMLLVAYEEITALKIVDVVDSKIFLSLGFDVAPSK